MRMRWLACSALAWLLLACAGAPAPVTQLREAELWIGESETPPGSDVAWTPVELPDRWLIDRRLTGLDGWYRIPVPRPAPGDETWSLLARVYPNAAFFVNGVEIGRGGRMEPPISRNSFRSLYFSIPHTLWRDGENWLQVRFVGTPGSVGRVFPIRIGPASAILPLMERDRLLLSLVPLLSVTLCVLLGSALLLTANSAPSGQRAFAGALLCVASASVSVVAPDAPLPNRFVEWLAGSALNWAVLFFAIGTARRAGQRLIGERVWLWSWAALTVLYGLVPPFTAPPLWLAWGFASGPLLLYTSLRLSRDGWRQREWGSLGAGVVATSLVASVLMERFSDWTGSDWTAFSGLTALLFLLGFGGYLLFTVLYALRSAEDLNRVLDARVAAREKELEASHAQQRVAERERALADERTRLMRDMHDGTGGRLVSALSLLRSGGATPAYLEDALVEAIDDLHLTIDSLRPGAMDLPSVLGLLRARLERQLRPHGVRLEWAIGDAGEGDDLTPDQVLHVIRIVQEAVANALRHSGGANVRVATGCGSGVTWFEVADDGRGGAKPRAGGRGLANLEQRAAMLGGSLTLDSRPGGTRLRVTL
jgi:signal transduction histidine kinase